MLTAEQRKKYSKDNYKDTGRVSILTENEKQKFWVKKGELTPIEKRAFLKKFFGYETFEETLCHHQIDKYIILRDELKAKINTPRMYDPKLYCCQCDMRDMIRYEHAIEHWTDRLNGKVNSEWDSDGRKW